MKTKIAGLDIDTFIETQENIIDQLEKDRTFLRRKLATLRVRISRAKGRIEHARQLGLDLETEK